MVKMLKLRLGVADDPAALAPSLNDCLGAVLQQSEPLIAEVLQVLVRGSGPTGPQSVAAFQAPVIQSAIATLNVRSAAVRATFTAELSRLVYEGGGKDEVATEVLRYVDLQLFGDAELD